MSCCSLRFRVFKSILPSPFNPADGGTQGEPMGKDTSHDGMDLQL